MRVKTQCLGDGAWQMMLVHGENNITEFLFTKGPDYAVIYDLNKGGMSAIKAMERIVAYLRNAGFLDYEDTLYETSRFSCMTEVQADPELKQLKFLEID